MTEFKRREFLRMIGAGLGASALGAARSAGAAAPPPSAPRPNIVLIMADDMGFSDIGCYGSELATPTLDRLAAGGLRFAQFYNAARCCPTRASLLTGLYPHQAGMGGMVRSKPGKGGPYQGYLNRRCVTIAEALRQAGYATYMSGKWHVGEFRPVWPIDRGFDKAYGLVSGGMNYWNIRKSKHKGIDRVFAHNADRIRPGGGGFYATDAFSDQAVRMLREHKDPAKPFFFYLAFNAPHWPLHAPEKDIRKHEGKYLTGWPALREQRWARQKQLGLPAPGWSLSEPDAGVAEWDKLTDAKKREMDRKMAVYAAQIEIMDRGIGRVVAQIEKMGQLDNTLILFLSDNGGCHEGGPFGMNFRKDLTGPIGSEDSYHSYGQSWANASNVPFRMYKHWVHEGGIATPLVVHWPARIRGNSRGAIRRQVGHIIDVMPTCLQVAGATYPDKHADHDIQPAEGLSLLPAFDGKPLGERTLYWEHSGNRAIRAGDWKLVAKGRNGPWQLHDLSRDRGETTNLADKHPDRVEQLAAKWRVWAKRVGVAR